MGQSQRILRATQSNASRMLVNAVLWATALGAPLGTNAEAATLPAGFSETLIASGLSRPTAMAIAPDGRIFVCLQDGQLRVVKDGALLPTPFLTLSVNSSGERGLLGVAFDPAFASNRFVYVYYTTATSPIHNRVSRFIANGDVAEAGSEDPILDLEALGASNHNGGAIHFGIDGKLYVAVGDNAIGANAQTLTNRLGKLLRINSNGTIPTGNPFYSTATGSNRAIWALGLRNPFTFSVQPVSGRILINDVGANAWEEINDGMAGANYGWNLTEGPTTDPRFETPLFAYDRRGTEDCAITGGAFYNPIVQQFPAEYAGAYFFADFCGGWIRKLEPDTGTVSDFAEGIGAPVDLQVADDGSLYYLARQGGVLYRINFAGVSPGNLVVSQLSAPRGVASGAAFNVTLKTTNQGNGSAAASHTALWLSINQSLGGDSLLLARAVPALEPSESNKATVAVTLSSVTAGIYFLIGQADTNGTVSESHEGDNLRVTKLRVGPDLRAGLTLNPTSPSSNAPTAITVVTTNVGFDVTPQTTTRLYRSSDKNIGAGDTLVAEWTIPPLNPQQARSNTVTVTLPAGTFFLIAAADVANAVGEVEEALNITRVKLTVP